ncbi:hypothetical protein Cob_v012223 [Colletotrichum orbiculare MAFF 240422]|uniref:Uncharacterized protein n=1 Tax=Colletotrichum orbiculare (strain 104-T / ATCC 96160 / CBS 514.97 / LARS 414 / MAFF 240422) TaxID=1213857 RepID=A0A484FA00_COLOR|nr:hypothetical protein Cob_v012223 [Colletotrichum orbiculare MAFF 240422]
MQRDNLACFLYDSCHIPDALAHINISIITRFSVKTPRRRRDARLGPDRPQRSLHRIGRSSEAPIEVSSSGWSSALLSPDSSACVYPSTVESVAFHLGISPILLGCDIFVLFLALASLARVQAIAVDVRVTPVLQRLQRCKAIAPSAAAGGLCMAAAAAAAMLVVLSVASWAWELWPLILVIFVVSTKKTLQDGGWSY